MTASISWSFPLNAASMRRGNGVLLDGRKMNGGNGWICNFRKKRGARKVSWLMFSHFPLSYETVRDSSADKLGRGPRHQCAESPHPASALPGGEGLRQLRLHGPTVGEQAEDHHAKAA